MALPTGAVDSTNFGYDITAGGDTRDAVAFYSYMYVVCKVDLQPSKWAPANREDVYHNHETSVAVDIAASGGINATVRIGKETADKNAVLSDTGPSTPVNWLTSVTESVGSNRTTTFPNYNESKVRPQYIIVELRVSRNVTSTLSESVVVNALYVEAKNDSAYSGNDLVSFGNGTVGQKLNNPFDSLSAAMMKDAIAENLNKIMYESTNAFCVPLFGDY